MDDDRNKVMIVIGLVLLGIMFVGMFFFRPAKTKPESETAVQRIASKEAAPAKTHQQTQSQPQRSTRRVGSRVIRGAAEAEKAREAHAAKLRKGAEKWLESLIVDTSISSHTRELYAARNHPAIQSGVYHLYNGDEQKAAEEFEEAANNLNNRLSVRFIAIKQRYYIARTQNNNEDYFKWGKKLGEMLRDNDLSFFEQEQNSEFLERVKYQEIYYKARNNKSMQEAIASYLVNEEKGYDKELAMEEVLRRIQDVEEELQG